MERPETGWTFVTTHTLVLLSIAADPEVRLSEIATQVGITERRVQSIVTDLVDSGYVKRVRQGRRNRYEIDASLPLRHVELEHHKLGELLIALTARTHE